MSKLSLSCTDGKTATLHFPYNPAYVAIARDIPGYRKFDKATKTWKIKPTKAAVKYLMQRMPGIEFDEGMLEIIERFKRKEIQRKENLAKKEIPLDELDIEDYKFGTDPYDHQKRAFGLAKEREAFAFFMDMGTGKTKVAIDDACYLYNKGLINAILVVAPNSVKTNWITEELPIHVPEYIEWYGAYWNSTPKAAERKAIEGLMDTKHADKLKVLVVNFEALSSSKKAVKFVEDFVQYHNVYMAVDESSRIKTPGSNRTKEIQRLGKLAKFRRIMTGTPITQSPMDLYSQFTFLDEDILGYGSFYAFRNRYAVMGGFESREIIAYQNVPELQDILEGYSYRVTKDECLDLPDKVFVKRTVELSKEQKKAYEELRLKLRTEIDGEEISVDLVLTKLLRLQQITGGFVPFDDGDHAVAIPGGNPRVDEVVSIAGERSGKMIIWARFRPEIEAISRALRKEYGEDTVVEFHGGVNDENRIIARQSFQDPDSPVEFFIGQQQSGGIGLTLTQAKTVVYYSNTFSLEERLQSEDRAHRIGQTDNVTYIDLEAPKTVDEKVVKALRRKQEVASLITRDAYKEWI